ncbi:hypothetical protein BH18THE2_BH18THE2_35800 [soil metagenome]
MTFYDYKYSLDYVIIGILYYEGGKSYRELKRRIESYSKARKGVSFDTYNRHIDSLSNHKILDRKRANNRVFLSLRQEYRRKLDNGHLIDEDKHFQEKRKRNIPISSLIFEET